MYIIFFFFVALCINTLSELKVNCLFEYNCEFGGLKKTEILKI